MKKIIYFFIFISLFAGTKTVKANSPNPNPFWSSDHKIACASIINTEAVGDNAFLVFDYSAKTGQALGKPWSVVEKGKCYQLDDGHETVWLVKIVNGNEKEIISNYSIYKPTDEIWDVFCTKDSYNQNCLSGLPDITFIESQFAYSAGDNIDTGALLPVKYFFNAIDMVDEISSDYAQMMHSASFTIAAPLFSSLSENLNNVLHGSCDTRVRIEYQYVFDNTYSVMYVKNIVWRLASNQDALIESPWSSPMRLPDLNAVNLMGCKNALSSFILEHQTDFNTIDRLAQELISKYPIALEPIIPGYLPLITKRDSAEITKIMEFVNSPDIPLEIVPPPKTESGQTIVSTVLDEPTPEKKTDMVINSPNPLVRSYALLPVVALLGMIIFAYFKKK